LDRAIESYQTAIRINPNFADAHYGLGLALKQQNQKSAAIAQFQKARSVYQQQGNTKTVADIDRLLQELS
jgi:tetratricopeptide (TPR) repeat protein